MAKALALSRPPSASSPNAHQTKQNSTTNLRHRMRQLYSSAGHWIGSHQIQALLFSSLLISTLLTPALLLYLSPYESPASSILRLSRGALPWELEGLQRQGVLWSEDSVCWSRIAGHLAEGSGVSGRAIEAEQLLIGPTAGGDRAHEAQAVSKETLHKAWKVKHELERRLLAGEIAGLDCVRTQEGKCAVSSPTDWWDTEADLLSDTDVHRTLSHPRDSKLAGLGLPTTAASTLVGAVRDRHGHLRGADFLALTFYLDPKPAAHVTGRRAGTRHDIHLSEDVARLRAKHEWRQAVRAVVGGKGWPTSQAQLGKMSTTEGKGQKVMLKHLPRLSVQANPRLLENAIFALCYCLVFLHVYMSISDAAVHSKVGLLFTSCVELFASGVISLSICWLLGISIGLIPTALVPFLVLVCGVDSMNILINAVASTSLAQPIPERIAAAFADVGPSMVGTLVGELVLAWAIQMLVDVAIWKEITSLVLVILIVDFVLEVVFFTPVLSIDIQRLELADLIRQNPNYQMLPSTPSEQGDRASSEDDSSFRISSLFYSTYAVLKARPARAATFATLIGINIILYSSYGPSHYLPAFCSEAALSANPHRLSPALSSDLATALRRGQRGQLHDVPKHSGEAFWSLLNPANASAVRVYVEPVTAITFFSDTTTAPESIGPTFVGGTSTLVKVSIVLGPIVGTTAVLYLLLLYLLKDAELLAMKRLYSRKAREESKKPKGPPAAGVELAQLRGRHLADVELLASSKELIVSWAGLDDQLVVWRSRGGDSFEADTLQLPLTAGPASLVHLAIDHESTFCAAATSSGKILVWELDRKLLIDFSQDSSGVVANLGPAISLFASPSVAIKGTPAPPAQRHGAAHIDARPPQAFFAVHGKGEIVMYDCIGCTCSVIFRPAHSSLEVAAPTAKVRTLVASPASSNLWPIYVRADSSGKVQVYRSEGGRTPGKWSLLAETELSAAEDAVTAVAWGEFALGTGAIKPLKTILVLGTLSGQLIALDLVPAGEGATVKPQLLAEFDGAIKQISLAPPPKGACPTCAEPFGDGFQVIASTRQAVYLTRVSSLLAPGTTPGSGQCFCTTGSSDGGAVARSGSVSSLTPGGGGGGATPKKNKHRRASSSRSTSNNGAEDGTPTRPARSSLYPGGSSPNAFVDEDTSSAALNPLSPISLPPAYSPPKQANIPLFDPAVDLGSPGGGSAASLEGGSDAGWGELCVLRVASARIDERGGWDLLDRAVVGVRRRKHTVPEKEKEGKSTLKAGGGTSWEVWAIPLVPVSLGPGGTDQIGVEGRTPLEALTSRATPIEQPIAEQPTTPAASRADTSTLRRRQVSASSPTVSSPLRPRPNAPSSPSIRFEDVALPFSRARPVISALGDGAVALGLGNSIAVLSSANKSASGGGGRWGGGLLGIPRSESARGLGLTTAGKTSSSSS